MLNFLLRVCGLAAGLHLGLRVHWFRQPRPFPRALAGCLAQPLRLRYLDPAGITDLWGVTPDMQVLEAGCGTGVMTAALAARVSGKGKVTVVELQEPMLEAARARVEAAGFGERVEFHLGSPDTAPLKMHSADLIVLGSVLGEVPDVHSFLRRLFELARPESRAVVYEEILNPGFVSSGMARMHLHAAGFRQGGVIRKLTHYIAVYFKDTVAFDPELRPGASTLKEQP